MTRTDVHRPSAIDPADYEYVAVECVKIEDIGSCFFQLQQRAIIDAHMGRTGGTYSQHAHGGNCMVCGNANAIYTHLFYHAKSNSYVRMGEDCARTIDMGDGVALDRLRRELKDARDARAGKAKAQAILADAGLQRAWELAGEAIVNGRDEWAHETLKDIVGKLVRYGDVSDKQLAFLGKLVVRVDDAERIKAERAAARAAAPHWIAGRQTVTGRIVSLKVVDNNFSYYGGSTIKIVLLLADGRRLYCTLPAAVDVRADMRGDELTLKVGVEPAKDDPTMAFGKRPTLVKHQPAVAQAA